MTVPKLVRLSGAANIGPTTPSSGPFPSGDCTVSVNAQQTTQADNQFARTINSPTTFVDLLAGNGIANVTFLVLRVRAGTLTVRVTSPAGVDQLFDVSDLLVLSQSVSSSAWTALAVRGSADVEVTIAGT